MEKAQVIVIGGGVIGISLAYGLVGQGASVILIDRANENFTASRGNFGLVWVQGKGLGMRRYAEWCRESTDQWPDFAAGLEEETGIPLYYHKTGGVELCVGEAELNARADFIGKMKKQSSDGRYDCKMLSQEDIRAMIPDIGLGEGVSGGSFCPHDGIVNPLHLLRAFYRGFHQRGGKFRPGREVREITGTNAGFRIETETEVFESEKLVIASGLATTRLSEKVGIRVPVSPQRGQVLVTEKTGHVFPFATGRIRQNSDGSFMFGASHEDVGYDLGTSDEIMRDIVSHALTVFPSLRNLQLVRTWGSLRVLTPDKMPVYVESEVFPGAFAVTSHSGVSLAPLHSGILPAWVLEGKVEREFEVFHPRRFYV